MKTEDFFSNEKVGGQEAKYNIFKFQDHILYFMHLSAECFTVNRLGESFDALTMVMTDVRGHFDKDEKEDIDNVWFSTLKHKIEYSQYMLEYEANKRRGRSQNYDPPTQFYYGLLRFRSKLMEFMSNHKMLFLTVSKSGMGAGSR